MTTPWSSGLGPAAPTGPAGASVRLALKRFFATMTPYAPADGGMVDTAATALAVTGPGARRAGGGGSGEAVSASRQSPAASKQPARPRVRFRMRNSVDMSVWYSGARKQI